QNHWFGQVDLTLTITSNNDGSYNQTFPVVVPNPFASIIPNQIITDDTSQTHNLIQWFPHPVSGDVSLSVSSSNTDIVQTTLVQDTLIQLDVLNDASSIYGFTDVIIWANYPFSHSVSDTFVLTHSPGNQLVINEIHYNPAGSQGSDSEFEFIELSNSSNHTIRLENTLLSNEINFGFSETNAILPDSFVVVARDRDALLAWYPNLNSDIVFEGFTELLSNTNGSIKLTFNGYALDSLTYSDTDPWPSGADGIGPSVELVNQTLNNEYGENWQVSTSTGGTPGYQNSVYDIQVPTWSQSPPNLVFDEDADTTLAFSIWYNIVTDNSPDSLLVFSFLNTGVIHPLVNGDSVNFTIDANWNGETDIGVRVSDGALFSEETIHIIVNPVNDAPTITAINDTSYVEDNSLNFVLTSTDIDSDNLVYSAFSDTTAISVTVSDSLISFTSSLNWNGSSLITAMVSDGEYSDSTNFTLTVNPVNDAPTITVITDTTFNEDDLLSFVLSSFDIDEDDVSYFAFTDTSAVQVSITDSLLTITTNANWNGSSLITAMVSDGEYSDSTNFTLTVNPVNDAPVLTQQFLDVNILEDDFGAILIPRIEDYFMEVDSNDIMQFYANTFDAGLDSIVFISESDGLLARGFSMNEKPTKKSHFKRVKRQNYVQTKNKSQKISNNNSFFQTVINRSSNRNNNDTTACIVYPSLNFTGEINIEIMATDLMEITTHDTLKLTIEPVNDPPVISSQSDITIFEDDSTNFTIVAIDVDSENLIYEVISSSSELTISLNNENCTLIPNENWFGESQITLIVSDDEYSDTTEFVLSVLSVNDLPILETPLPDFTLDEDNGEIIILERLEDYFTDVDTITGDSLRFYLSSNTAGLDSLYLYIEPNSTGIYLLPKDNYFGEINIIVTATDDSMATVSDTFLLEILNVNDPPIITVQQTAVTNEETPIAIPFSVFDEEGANVFMSSFVDTSAVSITTTDTNLVITPYLNWFGEANVFLTADDGDTTVTDTILLTVANVNDAPVLLSEFSQFILSGKIAIPLFVNEVDGDEIQAIGAFRLSQSDSWQMMNVNTDTSYAGNVAFSVEWETLDKTGNQINWAYSETAECSLWVNDGLVNSNTLVFDSLTIANIAGDYNLDAKINAGDIGQLVGAFYQEGAGILDIDIGPSTGTAPFVTTVQDSVIDFEDLATFTQSWYWGAENLPGMNRILLAKSIQNDGNEIFTLRAKSNRILSLNISELITEGFDLFIQYDTTEIQFETIQHEISNSAISMSSHIPEMGYFSLSSFSKNGMMDFSGNLVEIVVSSGLADAVEIIVGIKRYENSSDDSPFVYARKTIEWVDLLPKEFALHQNYPNPFNPTTTLRYDLPEDSKVSLIIYDIMGREVKRLVHVTQEAGFKSVLWNGKNNHGSEVSAGMYLYRISAGNFISVKKMVLLK
nr:tandem-95 repeat protein [Candidatus Neomarinimicrobiota bacterium]